MIDARSKKVVATLKGIDGKGVIMSSKFIEIHFKDGKPIRVGDQFGIGRVIPKAAKTAAAPREQKKLPKQLEVSVAKNLGKQ